MDAVLHTERLTVRLWTLEDADDAYSIYGDPDLSCYVPGGAHASPAQTRAWLEQRVAIGGEGLGFWALVEKDSGRIIGGAMLDEEHTPGEVADVRLGFHLDHDGHEQGYAEEVASALVRYGFGELQLDRIVGVVLPEDLMSRRVLEKVGMLDEGEALFGNTPVGIMAIHRSLEEGKAPSACLTEIVPNQWKPPSPRGRGGLGGEVTPPTTPSGFRAAPSAVAGTARLQLRR